MLEKFTHHVAAILTQANMIKMSSFIVIAMLYFKIHYVHCDESDETSGKLSIFDSPNFLTKTHINSIILYRELKRYRLSFGNIIGSIATGYGYTPFSCVDYRAYLRNIKSRCLGNTLQFASNTPRLSFEKLFRGFRYLRSKWNNKIIERFSLSSGDKPSHEFVGGLLGLLIIQDTYNLNIERFARGQISAAYLNNKNETLNRACNCNLNAIDLLALAAQAKQIHWHESSLLFADHSMRYFHESQKNISLYPLHCGSCISNFTLQARKRQLKRVPNIKTARDILLPFSNRGISELYHKFE